MDMLKREIELLDRFTARQAAVLIRLAAGKSISQTARELKISRTTIYQLKKTLIFGCPCYKNSGTLLPLASLRTVAWPIAERSLKR